MTYNIPYAHTTSRNTADQGPIQQIKANSRQAVEMDVESILNNNDNNIYGVEFKI